MSAAAVERPHGDRPLIAEANRIMDRLPGYRVEIIEGQILVSPPPDAAHARALSRLMTLDAKDNRVTVYFDGVEQSDLTVSTKEHGGTTDDFEFPAFDKLKLGWQLYQADPTPSSYDIRLDDIAVTTRRTGGCGA